MKRVSATLAFAIAVVLVPMSARADYQYTVSMDTSNLTLNSTYTIAFALVGGSGVNDGNNTVTVSNFAFTNGSLGSANAAYLAGSPTGSLATSLGLTDTVNFTMFGQDLTATAANSQISFLVDTTTNLDAGGTNDGFSVGLYDSKGNSIATTDPTNSNNLVFMEINGNPPSVTAYDGTAPVINVKITPQGVPEPASLALFGIGLGVVGLSRRFKNRRAA